MQEELASIREGFTKKITKMLSSVSLLSGKKKKKKKKKKSLKQKQKKKKKKKKKKPTKKPGVGGYRWGLGE